MNFSYEKYTGKIDFYITFIKKHKRKPEQMQNIIPYSWIGKLSVIKIPLLKLIYRFKAIPIKALIGFLQGKWMS